MALVATKPKLNTISSCLQNEAWSDEGLECFNKLIEEVQANCDCESEHGIEFEEVFMKETMEEQRNEKEE